MSLVCAFRPQVNVLSLNYVLDLEMIPGHGAFFSYSTVQFLLSANSSTSSAVMSTSADVLILGAGPAGLTAAITLARQVQSSIVLDDGTYRNDPAEYMHLIPGFDHVSPEHFRKAAKENMLSNYEQHISIQMANISSADKDESTGQFTLKDDAGKEWQGKKLILANGIEDVFPPIEGYGACWGKAMYVSQLT